MTAFVTICADPPWPFSDGLPGRARGATKHYRLMRIAEISRFLASSDIVVAPNARLFLWRVASMQEEALAICRAWGFEPKAEMVWLKTNRQGGAYFGMGRTVRMSHEAVLIGQRGRPERLSASVRSVFRAPYAGHSVKPDAFYELVEKLSPGPYLDLFARRERPGWMCLGDGLGC